MTDLCIRHHYELVQEIYSDAGDYCEIQPAEATRGLLCGKCYARLRTLLGESPELISYIRAQVAPAMQAARGERVAGTRDLPIPLNATAVEDSHDLYAQLVNWFTSLARTLRIRPPATILEAFRKDTDATQLPFWADPVDARDLVRDLNNWYLRNERAIACLPAVGPFEDDLIETARRLNGRYPQAPRSRSLFRKRMCPFCGEQELGAEWVGETAGDVEIKCAYCGYEIPPQYQNQFIEWGAW